MPPKRKRASSPIFDIHKRTKRGEELLGRDSEQEKSRASRRKTISAITPLRTGIVTATVLRTPAKRKYGRNSKHTSETLASDAEDGEEEEEPELAKPLLRSDKAVKKGVAPGKPAKASMMKAKAHKSSQQAPVTPAKATSTPANKSRPKTSSSGAVFDDDTPSRGRQRASSPHSAAANTLVLNKLPSKAEINRMLKKHKHTGTTDTDNVTTDVEDETQPTPCPPRKPGARGRKSGVTDATEESDTEVASPKLKRTPRKSTGGKPLANLGTLLDKQLSQASRSIKYRESVSSLADSMSEDDEATPTKKTKSAINVKRLLTKTTTPKNITKFFASSVGSYKTTGSTPLRRPKKGRPSYTAKVAAAPVFDIAKSDAVSQSSSRRDELLVDSIVRSTPTPDTETEYNGTEGNLTPASARAFVESSSPVAQSDYEEEMEIDENDEDGRIILDESTMPVSQPVSPSKHALPKVLPEKFSRFIEPQKRLVMKMLRSPPFIDVAPPVLDERAPVEATAYRQLIELLKGTCERGEGNSCLLLGPRGSGKSLVLNSALEACSSNPIILRLSGHTQTTDRLAMREVAYQLTHQTGVAFNIPDDEDGDETHGKPAPELGADEQVDFTPPAAYLPALISQLTSLKRPVVVVLDAFDLFVAHPRQALLYCLLDTAQSCRAGDGRNGLLVVGASCVVNCVNYLEKRVKSRFSHRILKVANPSTIEEYTGIARRLLSTPLDESEADVDKRGKTVLAEWRELWKTSVEHFVSHKTTRNVLTETFAFRRDIGNLARLLTPVALDLQPSRPWLTPQLLVASEVSQLPEQYDFLNRLPQAAMWVLVSLYHWGSAGHEVVNLKMVLDACSKAATYQDGFRLVVSVAGESRGVSSSVMAPAMLQTAFEELVRLRVLQAVNGPSGSQSSEFVKYRCMVDRETLRKVVDKHGSTAVKTWLGNAGTVNA